MTKENFINVNFYKKGKKDKALQLFLEKDYKQEDLMQAVNEVREDMLTYYEDCKYIIEMTFYNYDKDYNTHVVVDKKCFTCYGDDGCLRLNLNSELMEDIDYYFFESYGFWFEEFLKKEDKYSAEEIEEIYNNYDNTYDFIRDYEEDDVYKEFKKIIWR